MHSPTPKVCASCCADVGTLAETMGGNPTVSFCSHLTQPGEVVLILAFQSDGKIRRWSLDGPLTLQDAQRRAAQIAALAPPKSEIAHAN